MQSIRFSMQLAAIGIALQFVVSPVKAVTCDEVRSLSATELSNWAKRLKVQPAELAGLLDLSFCAPNSERQSVIASERKSKPISRTPSSL
jgi:hypothetical protein